MDNLLAKRMKEMRSKLGLTQKQLAEKAEISVGSYSAYENNKKMPPLDMANRLAETLGVSLDWLCGKGGEPGESLPQSQGDVLRLLSQIAASEGEVDIDIEEESAHVLKAVFGIRSGRYGAFFREWKDVYTLFERDTIPRDMYDAWMEKKIDEYSQYPVDKNWKDPDGLPF